jgi:hypothetical protein
MVEITFAFNLGFKEKPIYSIFHAIFMEEIIIFILIKAFNDFGGITF